MRVRTNALYIFRPNGWDRFDPKADIASGTVVRVVRLPSAPPPNTMGQAYVADPETGEFLGMVSTGSLVEVTMTLPLSTRITREATRWLTAHNRGLARWECPVCPESPYVGPGGRTEPDPRVHAENCLDLREEALNRLDRRITGHAPRPRRRR